MIVYKLFINETGRSVTVLKVFDILILWADIIRPYTEIT